MPACSHTAATEAGVCSAPGTAPGPIQPRHDQGVARRPHRRPDAAPGPRRLPALPRGRSRSRSGAAQLPAVPGVGRDPQRPGLGTWEIELQAPPSDRVELVAMLWPQDDRDWPRGEINLLEGRVGTGRTLTNLHWPDPGTGEPAHAPEEIDLDLTLWHRYRVDVAPGSSAGSSTAGSAASSTPHTPRTTCPSTWWSRPGSTPPSGRTGTTTWNGSRPSCSAPCGPRGLVREPLDTCP